MVDIIEEKKHARLSPSGAKRWMSCPGSIQFVEKLGLKDTPSKYAAEGTVAHEIHASCLMDDLRAEEYLGHTFEADGFRFTVSQEMVDAVQMSLDYIENRIDNLMLNDLRTKVRGEVPSSLEYLGIPGLEGGTADIVILSWDDQDNLDSIEIIDYKHGAGVSVEATDNPQAMCYALGIAQKYNANPETIIHITISQPRVYRSDGFIRTWSLEAEKLINWQNHILIPAAKATQKPDAPLVPSEEACRFCRAAGNCPELFEAVQESAMMDFESSKSKLPDVKNLSADQKLSVMDNAGMIRSFLVSVEEQAKYELDHGSKEYDAYYKLVRKTTRRKFKENATDELVSPLFEYLDRNEIFEEKCRNMTDIEARLKKSVGIKEAKEIMAEVTTKPVGELVIAPLSDKRKAEEPTISSEFQGAITQSS